MCKELLPVKNFLARRATESKNPRANFEDLVVNGPETLKVSNFGPPGNRSGIPRNRQRGPAGPSPKNFHPIRRTRNSQKDVTKSF